MSLEKAKQIQYIAFSCLVEYSMINNMSRPHIITDQQLLPSITHYFKICIQGEEKNTKENITHVIIRNISNLADWILNIVRQIIILFYSSF